MHSLITAAARARAREFLYEQVRRKQQNQSAAE
jgi:hypothetical protein